MPYGNPLPPEGKKWQYVWGDEFSGTELDRSKWGYPPNHWNRKKRNHHDICTINWGRSSDNVTP